MPAILHVAVSPSSCGTIPEVREMRPHDTNAAAHDAQIRSYRQMTPERRAEIAFELSDAVRRIARTGIQERHPGYSEPELARALVALLYGSETARRVWPNEEPPPP